MCHMLPPEADERAPIETADGSRTLFSERFGQTMHSEHGAVTEATWVFLQASGVAERLACGEHAHVLEVGFGTGLNFLVTADFACARGASATYVALERILPPPEAMAALGHAGHLAHPRIASDLMRGLDRVRDREPAHTTEHAPTGFAEPLELAVCGATLELRLGDATHTDLEPDRYHAVYHDGFSPDANPELWTEGFLAKLERTLAPGGVLVTYTVKGTVRRALADMGLDVEKRPGPPGGKREMLWARKPVTPRE